MVRLARYLKPFLLLVMVAIVLLFMQAMADLSLPGYMAVSYTHLRAHETVLDLVCRLLLEKKNTSIYTI